MKLVYFGIIFLFFGCMTPQIEKKQPLHTMLLELDSNLSIHRAGEIEALVYASSREIKEEFTPIGNPWLNNLLVDLHIKKSGLCWQWADALYVKLLGKVAPFEIYPVGANIGRLNEHNAIIITQNINDIHNAILIDLWRKSGVPFVCFVKDDTEYAWSIRSDRF